MRCFPSTATEDIGDVKSYPVALLSELILTSLFYFIFIFVVIDNAYISVIVLDSGITTCSSN